jgi:hypothetical protein
MVGLGVVVEGGGGGGTSNRPEEPSSSASRALRGSFILGRGGLQLVGDGGGEEKFRNGRKKGRELAEVNVMRMRKDLSSGPHLSSPDLPIPQPSLDHKDKNEIWVSVEWISSLPYFSPYCASIASRFSGWRLYFFDLDSVSYFFIIHSRDDEAKKCPHV